MISKINRIKDFVVFLNYRWDASISDFKKYNLLFGWNYSGKTTISRVFQCFEKHKIHTDYPSATFELLDEKGNPVMSLYSC